MNSLTTGLGLERASEQHIVHNTWQCSLYTISKSKRGHHTLCSAYFSTTHSNFCFTDSLLFWPVIAHLFRLTINSIVSSQYPHKIFPTSQNIANQGARGLLTHVDFNGRDYLVRTPINVHLFFCVRGLRGETALRALTRVTECILLTLTCYFHHWQS